MFNEIFRPVLEEAVSNNENLKSTVTLIQPSKKRPKMIIYNVNNDTSGNELNEALTDQNDVLGTDNKVLFKMGKKDN